MVVCAVLLSGTAVASAAFTGWPADLVRVCRELVAGPPPVRGAARVIEGQAPRSVPAAARAATPEATDAFAAPVAPPLARHPIREQPPAHQAGAAAR